MIREEEISLVSWTKTKKKVKSDIQISDIMYHHIEIVLEVISNFSKIPILLQKKNDESRIVRSIIGRIDDERWRKILSNEMQLIEKIIMNYWWINFPNKFTWKLKQLVRNSGHVSSFVVQVHACVISTLSKFVASWYDCTAHGSTWKKLFMQPQEDRSKMKTHSLPSRSHNFRAFWFSSFECSGFGFIVNLFNTIMNN